MKGAWKVIRDDDTSALIERFNESRSVTWLGLDIRIVKHRIFLECLLIRLHPVDDEPMKALARPRIPDPHCLEHHQRLPQSFGVIDSAIERENCRSFAEKPSSNTAHNHRSVGQVLGATIGLGFLDIRGDVGHKNQVSYPIWVCRPGRAV